MIAIHRSSKEIDTLDATVLSKIDIQSSISYIIGLFWIQVVFIDEVGSCFWTWFTSKTALACQNFCKIRIQS